ncbi:bglA [Symbiodinium sp. CCMP2592]|nr:bglA [Symbiodinium sp. CCMP2592]
MKKVFGALALCSLFVFFRRDFWSRSGTGYVEADVAPAKVASAKLSETLKVEEQKRRKYAFVHTSKTSRRSFCEAEGWDLEWSDEFSGDSLNLTSWEIVSSQGGYDNIDLPVGGLNVTACRCAACRRENAVVEDGKLRIVSDRDPEDNTRYYSAALSTKGRLSWTTDDGPFRVCIRAKLPLNTRGVWPAHWMLPENGLSDRCLDEGEMDILEMVSGDGKAYHAYHWMSSWPGSRCGDFDTFHRSVSSSMIVREYSTEFHEYAVERTPDGIRYAIDGIPTGGYRAAERGFTLSSAPWFLILNTAIGGGWPGYPAPEVTSMPVEHVIDWVRVVRRSLVLPPCLQLPACACDEPTFLFAALDCRVAFGLKAHIIFYGTRHNGCDVQLRASRLSVRLEEQSGLSHLSAVLCSWCFVYAAEAGCMDAKVKNTFIHVDDGEDGELVPRLEELS